MFRDSPMVVVHVLICKSVSTFQPGDLVPCTQDLLLAVFQLQLSDTLHVSGKSFLFPAAHHVG